MDSKKILVVSGCMAVQARVKGNINENALYHQVLKNDFQKNHQLDLDFDILTYSHVNRCMEKVRECSALHAYDLIVFQIRTMDYFMLLGYKKVYKSSGTTENEVPESESFTKKIARSYRSTKSRWRDKNARLFGMMKKIKQFVTKPPILFFGACMALNRKKADDSYKKLVSEIICFSQEHHIPILFLGATSRPNSLLEDAAAARLNKFMLSHIECSGHIYLDMFGKFDEENNYKFVLGTTNMEKPNLSEIGHREAARKIKKHLLPLFFATKAS